MLRFCDNGLQLQPIAVKPACDSCAMSRQRVGRHCTASNTATPSLVQHALHRALVVTAIPVGENVKGSGGCGQTSAQLLYEELDPCRAKYDNNRLNTKPMGGYPKPKGRDLCIRLQNKLGTELARVVITAGRVAIPLAR